jgi:hypothetical protein
VFRASIGERVGLVEVFGNVVVGFVIWFNDRGLGDEGWCLQETFSGLATVQGQLEMSPKLGLVLRSKRGCVAQVGLAVCLGT